MAAESSEDGAYLRMVGLRVRLRRVATGLSQEELGTRCGVSRVTVGSIERGDHPASVLAYRRLASAFGVPLSELLDDGERPPAGWGPPP